MSFAFSLLTCLGCLLSSITDDQMKTKEKNRRIVVKDKSKPVRKALEIQYGKLAEAVQNKDFAAFQALRTTDFHTVDEQGRPQTPAQMAARAKAMLERIQAPIKTSNEILVIDLKGNDAKATVRQYFSRMQDVAGKLRKVETYVTQDETWTQTSEGWKLKFVDNEREMEWYVDGKRIEPGKPYDPDAPPYDPKKKPSK
jgi:hypothetical protein